MRYFGQFPEAVSIVAMIPQMKGNDNLPKLCSILVTSCNCSCVPETPSNPVSSASTSPKLPATILPKILTRFLVIKSIAKPPIISPGRPSSARTTSPFSLPPTKACTTGSLVPSTVVLVPTIPDPNGWENPGPPPHMVVQGLDCESKAPIARRGARWSMNDACGVSMEDVGLS